jgi:putative PIN family toxin of toxin-antitoxin system
LVLSIQETYEIRDVLTRPRTLKKFPKLTIAGVEAYLKKLGRCTELVTSIPCMFQLPRDPKDEKILNLAIAASAHFILTRDLDLLDLMTKDDESAVNFRQRFPAITILTPESFLAQFELDF